MPYKNMPESMWGKMDKCVSDVQGKGNDKQKAIAICYTSLMKGKELDATLKSFALKAAPKYRKAEKAITDAPNLRDRSAAFCRNCKFFQEIPSAEDQPQPAYPEGICNKYDFLTESGWVCDAWEVIPPAVDAQAVGEAIIQAVTDQMPGMKEARFSIEKQADGHYRWLASTSSSYKDRDQEIIAQKALEDDTEQMNAAKQFGDADWWHTPLALASCDFSAMHGRISMESGVFYDDYIGEKMAQNAPNLAMSRSFYHPINEPDAEGVYHNIHTFRRAFLPRGKESNLLTMLYVSKEEREMLADKIKELKQLFGGNKDAEAKVDALLQVAQEADKAAEAAGITNKEAAPAPEVKPEAPAAKPETPGWFVADMKPEEFTALLVSAMKSALDPMVAEIKTIKEAQAVATKEEGKVIVTEIAKVAQAQGELGKRVAALEGETPRGFRPSISGPAPSAELKEKTPAADEKVPYFATFIDNITGVAAKA